jgi:N-acetylneuraminic acid mutarotase
LGALLVVAGLQLAAGPVQAEQYPGNGNTGFGGAIGNGALTLTDDGTNISGTLAVGGSMDDVLVLYIQSGPGGFTNTAGFNDQGDYRCQAISGVSASGRSLLTFASGFQPSYAITLGPSAVESGSLWQLANGGNGSLVYLGSVNLAPLNNTGPYSFSFPAALIGMLPGIRSTIQVFGTYVRADGSRSTEAIAGNLTGTQGWNSFTQTACAGYTFDASAVLVKLLLGVWTQRVSGSALAGRYNHTAVWTGSEMIVWGGCSGSSSLTYYNDGMRYNPTANNWTAVQTNGAPAARSGHTAVWTGSEMIVWGGGRNDGGRYNPAANSWMAVPTNGAPAARSGHTAIWTGSEMIVWGGYNGGNLNNGGRYSPTADTWTDLPTTGAPAARRSHTAVWTDTEMVIWGGFNGGGTYFSDGGRYNPVADSWTTLSTTGAPFRRSEHAAVWTGGEMIIWGGYGNPGSGPNQYLNNGGRYNPVADSWTAVPTNGAPAAREWHTAVWTGNEMIVWGGTYSIGGYHYLNDGGRYNPVADSWILLQPSGAPAARTEHTAVWTGSEMIIWGGGYIGSSWVYLNDGGRYNPAANSWMALPISGAPTARQDQTAVWTGSEMIVWGGYNGGYLDNGGRYNPTANNWTAVQTNGAPTRRYYHTAVWTGSEMIIWGGQGNSIFLGDGARYNPAADTWTPVTSNGAPAGRYDHTAVWTGSEMIIWGGSYPNGTNFTYCNDGGRYNPIADSWTALPTTGAPAGRQQHKAVWTGNEMIIWGGCDGSTNIYCNEGGRYNPAADSWTAVATNGAPAGRFWRTAVWTGSEVIVWGGSYWNGTGNTYVNDGGRYSPAGNNWTAIPSAGAPAGRQTFTAVWTGSEMIIFGGYGDSGYMSDPWSYYPYAPAVRISQTKSASADVAWPVWSSPLRLCQTTNLAAGQWTTVTNAATQVGEENHVTVSPLSGSQFFRAEYP